MGPSGAKGSHVFVVFVIVSVVCVSLCCFQLVYSVVVLLICVGLFLSSSLLFKLPFHCLCFEYIDLVYLFFVV